MGDIISLLPEHVANQIAAGEVVQRPSSVVKELLENSIDANSTNIIVNIYDAGKSYIQILDDGIGMTRKDAELCFERHATSKIKNANDLFKIKTKGFRGEALASISAVSQVELITKTKNDELGYKINIQASKISNTAEVTSSLGTSVVVKNLFFNIPARRSFLKSNQVEFRHIIDEFHRVALIHNQIHFELNHNNAEIFHLKATSRRQRIVDIFGKKFDERLVPVNEETEILKINGFVQKPEFAKKTKHQQFFFVNDRYIKSPFLNHSILSAFEGLLVQGYKPGYFLFLNVTTEQIDINIHPTKTEVKFEDEHSLYALLKSAVKHSLGQYSVSPTLDFLSDKSMNISNLKENTRPNTPRVSVDYNFNPFSNQIEDKKSFLFNDEPSNTFENSLFDTNEIIPTESFQLYNKYIFYQMNNQVYLVNQNRASQRVVYERQIEFIDKSDFKIQKLANPITLSLDKYQISVLDENNDLLLKYGFEFSYSSNSEVKIISIPDFFINIDVVQFLKTLLEKNKEGLIDAFFILDFITKQIIDKYTIKNGRKLLQHEQIELVHNLLSCKEPERTPFGLPTYRKLSENELKKILR